MKNQQTLARFLCHDEHAARKTSTFDELGNKTSQYTPTEMVKQLMSGFVFGKGIWQYGKSITGYFKGMDTIYWLLLEKIDSGQWGAVDSITHCEKRLPVK